MKPSGRSRSMRKIFKRTPGGKVKIHLKRRKKGKKNSCEICGAKIKRIRGDRRIFGGTICAECLSKVIFYYTRIIEGEETIKDIPLSFRKYVEVVVKK